MTQKTIDLLTTVFLLISMVAAVPAAINNPDGVIFVVRATLVYLSGLWQLWRLKKRGLK